MMAFWQAALRYVPVRPPTPGDPFVILKDPTGNGPNVSIDEMPPERGRLHLDLYTDDQEREVERLLRLGATRYRPREPGEDFVVLADPEVICSAWSTRRPRNRRMAKECFLLRGRIGDPFRNRTGNTGSFEAIIPRDPPTRFTHATSINPADLCQNLGKEGFYPRAGVRNRWRNADIEAWSGELPSSG
jgi:Glyoxalase-like domain